MMLEVMCVLLRILFVFPSREHSEVADGSAEGSVYDASVKHEW